MPKAKVRIGGQWVDLGVTSSEVDTKLANLENKINNADEYITGAFKDGIISVIEAKKIQSFLNQLDVAKKEYDTRYTELYNNPKLPTTDKTTLSTQKGEVDAAYNDLINTINTAIADNKASEDEATSVDEKFQVYRDELALLVSLMEKASDTIAGKHADQARLDAQAYTDAATADLEAQINDTNTYIDGAFKDGIIYDAEYRKIQNYLNTLQAKKAEFDNKYNQIYNNPKLSASVKTNLSTAKTNYDTAYTDLINSINAAIADQKATPTETADVDAKFATYRNNLSVLASAFEDAVYDITKEESDEASKQKKTVKVRYIRDWLNGNTVNSYNHWVEIQAYTGTTNIASGKTVTSNGTPTSGQLTMVTNGNTTSTEYVQLPQGAYWVQVDLGQVYDNIDYIKVWHYYADGRKYNGTKTEVSEDGVKWTVLFDSAKSGTYTETSEGHLIPVNKTGNTYASLINQTATTIKIQAERIDLVGKVNFSHLDSDTQQAVTTNRNLVKNSIFIDQRFWNTWTAEWTIDSTNKFEGVNTVRYNQTSQSTGNPNKKMTSNDIPVVEGKNYTLSVYVKSEDITSFDDITRVEFEWRNASGSAFQWNGISMTPTQNNVWERKVYTFTAPTGAVKCRLNYYVRKNGKLWVAKPMLQEGSVATPHTDELLISPWTASGTTEIDGAHIRTGTLSFDKAYGGTIKLGGPSYGNAKIEMYDENGELQIALNASDRALDRLTVGKIDSDYVVRRDPDMATTYYVDPVLGDDENDGLTQSTAFKTLQHAIDQLPKWLDTNIFINVVPNKGLYTENIYVNGFGGNGILFIDGGGFNNTLEGYIWVTSCSTQIVIQNMKVAYPYMTPPSSSHDGVVTNYYTTMLYLYNCQIYGRNKAVKAVKTYAGGHTHLSSVDLYDCTTHGISCERASFTLATNTGGQGMTYWAYCDGSWIIGAGTRPNYGQSVANNGQIVSSSSYSTSATGAGYNPPYTPTKTQYSKVYTTTSGDSWRTSFNAWRNDGQVMQGDWGYGLHRGYWFFGSQLTNDLTNADIKSMKLTVQRKTGHGYSTALVTFRWSQLASDPGADNSQPFVSNEYVQASFGLGQTRTINLPSSFFNYFKTGQAKGICIYTGTNTQANYAIFYPNATLEVIYEK